MPDIDFTGLRVLIADDEDVMRQLITRFLDQLGIKDVMAASDGFEAMAKFSPTERNFDLVICDLGMPNMNGIEFVKALRASEELPCRDVPVVVVTGHSEVEVVKKAMAMGIQGYVVKPVSMDALKARITAAVKAE